jgi:hypothetical protein
MYEMGLIGRKEYEKQRDSLLSSDKSSAAAPVETKVAEAPKTNQKQAPQQQKQPQAPQEDFQEGK